LTGAVGADFEKRLQIAPQSLVEISEYGFPLSIELERRLLRHVVDQFGFVESDPGAFGVSSSVDGERRCPFRISLTGHDDELIRRGDRAIIPPEPLHQPEDINSPAGVFDGGYFSNREACGQDCLAERGFDGYFLLAVVVQRIPGARVQNVLVAKISNQLRLQPAAAFPFRIRR